MKKIAKTLLITLIITICLAMFNFSYGSEIKTVADLSGKKVGCVAGTIYDVVLEDVCPDAIVQYFNTLPDCLTALKLGKIDAYIDDEPMAKYTSNTVEGVTYLPQLIYTNDYAYIMNKSKTNLKSEIDKVIIQMKNDGTLEQIADKWLGTDEDIKVLPNINLTGENGTIKFATNSTSLPFSYIKNNQRVGYDIDIMIRICEKLGYDLEIYDMDFVGIIPGIASGKYDIAGACITITDERKESVLFTEPNYQGGLVVVVREENNSQAIDFNGKKVGCLAGTLFADELLKKYPDSIPVYYNSLSDCLVALNSGKIDAYLDEEPSIKCFKNTVDNIDYLPEFLLKNDYAFIFNKENKKLEEEFSAVIKKMEQDGTLKQIADKWLGTDESIKVMPDIELTGENGTLELATNFTLMPFAYIKDNKYVGYDLEVVVRICYELGYDINIHNIDLTGLIPGIATKKYDVGVGCVTVTEERKQKVLFSYPNYEGGIVFVVLKNGSDVVADNSISGFFTDIKNSFISNFITENRYQMVLKGLAVTVIISLGAAVIGTILGFGICMARRSERKIFNIPAKLFIRLIQGTPILLILMILYYVVFAQSPINAVYVAIIGFAINFAVYTAEMMRTGIDAVDKGQKEAALALGFKPLKIFKQIIFPQAARHVLPVYKGEFISMVKMTSIVGYISIEDLTRVTDLIRTRTLDAFFPLIVTALIYFIITYLIAWLLTKIEIKIDPKSRKRIIKGVKKI